MAELHACFHLSQRRQAAGDDAAFNELIARLAKLSLVGRPFVG